MVFKIKPKKRRKIPKPEYFKEREVKDLGRHPSFQAIARAGTRRSAGVHERIFKEGSVVEYKGDLAKVEKVSKQGIHIRVYKKGKDDFPSIKSNRTKFLSVKDVEKGKVYPYFIDVPDLVLGYGSFGKK